MCAVSHASNNHQDLYHIIQGHLASSEMPFGGVGESGMGCYHGKEEKKNAETLPALNAAQGEILAFFINN